MNIDKDLLLLFLTLIIGILGFFIKSVKSDYDEKFKELLERIKEGEQRLSTISAIQISHAGEIKYIGEAINRVEQGFKDQERKREKFLEAIQAQINVLAEKIGELKK